MGPRWSLPLLTIFQTMGREKGALEAVHLPFKGMTETRTSHWPELNHMDTPSCKGEWEMWSVVGQPRSLLRLKGSVIERKNGYWWKTSSLCHNL